MALLADIASWACLLSGGFLLLCGGIGLIRLPDVFSRMHAAGITDTLAAGLILLGLMLQAGPSMVAIKLILIYAFLILTSPVATHALAKAALHGKLRPLLGKSPAEWNR